MRARFTIGGAALLGLVLLTSLSARATAFTLDLANYGWLDQYSLDTSHNFVGNEACVPTSSTNALTYLQNAFPALYGTSLSGTTYADWKATDEAFITSMGTTAVNGTDYDQFVYVLQNYITVEKAFAFTQFASMFPANNWSTEYPDPVFNTNGHPTASFLSDALAAQAAVLISIEYTNGAGGHELLVNGLDWDEDTNTGMLYFVDPLDPSQSYNGSVVEGAAKQSSGTLVLGSGGQLRLTYNQYEGELPYDENNYEDVTATLYGALAVSIPEPGVYGLLALGGLAMVSARRFSVRRGDSSLS